MTKFAIPSSGSGARIARSIYIVTGATVYRMYSILRSIGGLEIAICLSWSALSVKPEGVYTRIAI
jgi:hypothetical protein